MPAIYESVHFRTCTIDEYKSIVPNENSIYFVSDTKQVYVGSNEYTKSALTLESRPSLETEGEEGRIYICLEDGSSYAYIGGRWVVLYDPTVETVKSISAGECVTCDPNPITYKGTVSHSVPEGAYEIVPDVNPVKLKLGDTFFTNEVKTDKFGHVVELDKRSITLPSANELTTVFKFKGTVDSVDLLPQEGNIVGDVYYVVQDSAEYVYMESGWERLGPIVDLSGLVPKVPDLAGYVTCVSEDGSLQSAGYVPESGVLEGSYGNVHESELLIPCVSVDKYGRVTEAEQKSVSFASDEFAADCVAWILEKYMS